MGFGVHGVCSALGWSLMDLHIGDDLLSALWTSVECLPCILPLGVGDPLDLVAFYMMATWRWLLAWRTHYLGGGAFGILEEGIGP